MYYFFDKDSLKNMLVPYFEYLDVEKKYFTRMFVLFIKKNS